MKVNAYILLVTSTVLAAMERSESEDIDTKMDNLVKAISRCHITLRTETGSKIAQVFFDSSQTLFIPLNIVSYTNIIITKITTMNQVRCRTIVVVASATERMMSVMAPFVYSIDVMAAKPHLDIFVLLKTSQHYFSKEIPPCKLPLNYLVITYEEGSTVSASFSIEVLSQNCGTTSKFCLFPTPMKNLAENNIRSVIQDMRTDFQDSLLIAILDPSCQQVGQILREKHNFSITLDYSTASPCNFFRGLIPHLISSNHFIITNTFQVLDEFRSWQIVYSLESSEISDTVQNFISPFSFCVWIVVTCFIGLACVIFKLSFKTVSFLKALEMSTYPFIGVDPMRLRKLRSILYVAYLFTTFLLKTFYLCRSRSSLVAPASCISHKSFQQLRNENYNFSSHSMQKAVLKFYMNFFRELRVAESTIQTNMILIDKLETLPEPITAELHRQYKGGKHQAVLSSTEESVNFNLKIFPKLFDKNYFLSKEKFFSMAFVWWFANPSSDVLARTTKFLQSAGISSFHKGIVEAGIKQFRYNELKTLYLNQPEAAKFDCKSINTFLQNVKYFQPLSMEMHSFKGAISLCLFGNTSALILLLMENLHYFGVIHAMAAHIKALAGIGIAVHIFNANRSQRMKTQKLNPLRA
ncbi:unnamed protein product [Allacma fusca]|uniref:Uncharacterized protein n=1 Tax=Allacma fusca TaxID=39272 RepID=A0A8J2PZ39_9HEXA|nr:unnamed protein product [Allacma fusca]